MAFNLDRIKNALSNVNKEFAGKVAQVGLPKGINYEDGTAVAYVAAIQEFGAPSQNIPPRPFFTPTIAAKNKDWARFIGQGVVQVRKGSLSADDVLEAVGRVAAQDIVQTISLITAPPLKAATVKAKGFDKPLEDTGLMIASVQSKVGKTGGEFSV